MAGEREREQGRVRGRAHGRENGGVCVCVCVESTPDLSAHDLTFFLFFSSFFPLQRGTCCQPFFVGWMQGGVTVTVVS